MAQRPRKWYQSKPGRMTNGLVGLSSAAILSVYTVGYLHTQGSGDELEGPALAATAVPSPTATPGNGRASARQAATPSPDPTAVPQRTAGQAPATPTPAPSSNGALRDGSYVGQGTSRHGGIQATVEVRGGKIVSAAITVCGTRYPCSKISALPNEVVARQSAQIDYVSGATDSSRAYKQAIASALAQAV